MTAGLLLLSAAGSAALAAIAREDAPAKALEQPSVLPEPAAAGEAQPERAPGEALLGVILARASVDVVAPATGRIRAVDVRLGDRVPAGGRLALVDLPDARFELEVAEATSGEAQVELDRAQVELAQAEENLARRDSLVKEGLATGEDLAAAHYQVKLARVRVDGVKARLRQQNAKVGLLRHENAEAEIRASFEGIVAARYADPGARVQEGQPILRLIAASERFVRFAVPEDRLEEIELGQPVRVAAGRLELMGRVEKIAPEIDGASRMVFVEAGLEQVASSLDAVLSGEIARVTLPARPQK